MEGLKNLSKEQLHKILAALVLSDGHLYKHKGKPRSIRLSTSHFGEDQHRLFRYLCYELFGKDIKTRKSTAPSSKQRLLISTFNSVKFVPTLYSLCPEYNTTPGKLSKAEFLKIPQPNLQFIL
ncbi:TPA: hypothetical protein HA278_02435, partial [Candidatus Woesearchaeota archaeon]|nr:hypothetical protein [Candidatus Woesearchaeota archaeon]